MATGLRTRAEACLGSKAREGVTVAAADAPTRLRGVMMDVAERERLEAALARERGLLQSVLNSAGKAHLAYLDRDFNFVRVNQTLAATCGYRPEEMIGKNHFALYPHAENEAIFRRVRDTGTPFEIRDKPFEFPGQPERGVTYWDWTLVPVKDDGGQVLGLILSSFETTARVRAEEELREINATLEQRVAERTAALRESEERFRTMFEASADGLFLRELKGGRFYLANEVCLDMLGYSLEEFRHVKLPDLHVREDLPFIRREMAKFERGEIPPRAEVRFRRKDGSVFFAEVSPTTMRLKGKDYVLVALRDVSERMRLEAEIQAVSESERQRIGRDLHDGLGQTLTAVRYLASAARSTLARKSAPEAADLARIGDELHLAGRQLHEIARGLFPDEFRAGGIVPALRELAVSTSDIFQVQCRFSGPRDCPIADVNVIRHLYRIAQEAVNNAIKHSHGKRIWIRLEQGRTGTTLAVRDDGRGIHKRVLTRTDMGLHIMQYRADMIGATLSIQSARGTGTKVTCLLPARSRARTRQRHETQTLPIRDA